MRLQYVKRVGSQNAVNTRINTCIGNVLDIYRLDASNSEAVPPIACRSAPPLRHQSHFFSPTHPAALRDFPSRHMKIEEATIFCQHALESG